MRRYPGVSPFSADQQNIFFGRDKDISKLSKMISLRKQVLLYAKSGIGKTSLLNAGVLPKLKDKYTIISVRFFAYNDTKKNRFISPTHSVVEAIKKSVGNFNAMPKTIIDEIAGNQNIEHSLWYYFKQIELIQNNKFILVFDQFEELFSYPDNLVQEFKEQIYEVLHIDTPDNIMQLLAHKPEMEDDERIDRLYEGINVNTVFAIRSDRLSHLNILSDKLPDIQKTFYELKPLDNEQVKQAITKPASAEDNKYSTQAFTFEQDALDNIISILSENGDQSIEATQLQIVCQNIEKIAQKKFNEQSSKETIRIKQEDLPEFRDIFLNFYNISIAKSCKSKEEKNNARKFIEDQLIRNGQRISLDEIICFDHIKEEILKKLVDEHLLRAERNSTEGLSYELSHDTLIEPILISRKQRIEQEFRRQQEEELKNAWEKAEQEHLKREKQRKQQRRIIAIVSAAAIISIIFAIFGFWMWDTAEQQKKRVEEAFTRVELSYRREAILQMETGKYVEAKNKWKYLRDTILRDSNNEILNKKINECEKRIEQRSEYDSLMQSANNLEQQGEKYWLAAKLDYEKALKLQFDTLSCSIKIKEISKQIEDKIKVYKDHIKLYKTDSSPMGRKQVEIYERKIQKLSSAGNSL